ncbi:MAG: MarR family transcriptional regulator [Candidatus Omnitrophica bacterium]|nr:MarR family transcriptional regulator [Candidatus Omnitrophota bacterium]
MNSSSIESFSHRMIELLPQLMRGVARQESNALSKGTITLPQLWAMECVSRREGCSMHELAETLNISRPAATGLVDRLIVHGLARRTDDPQDRRVVRLTITPKGRRTVRNIWTQKRQVIARVFGRLTAQDRADYLRILERVVETLGMP